MRSFTFETLDPQDFDAFSATHPQGNFQQTSKMGDTRVKRGVEVEYLGVREDGRLVAATQFELHKSRLSSFAEIHDGPLCDFHDRELATFFFDALKDHAHKRGAAQLEITPEVPYQVFDSFGKALPAKGSDEPWPQGAPSWASPEPDREAFQTIVDYGFQHSGFLREYTAVPQWRYLKDLEGIGDEKALIASYNKNTKRNVRIARESCVQVRKIGREDLPTFHALCGMSGEKHGFENHPLSYFQLVYDCLGDDAEFTIAYIDTKGYLKSWEDKRDGFKRDVDHYTEQLKTAQKPEKVQKKLKDLQGKYEASLNRVDQARQYLEEDGAEIPVSAALFIWHPRECVYLFSGGNQKYAKFYAATALQHHAMMECIDRGVTSYNFYGINGIFDDPKDPGHGVLEFKQGFNGYSVELMGSFTLPVKAATYKVKQLAHKILGR